MHPSRRAGFSMLEVIISSMLIGVVMVAALDSAGSAMLAMRLKSERIDADTLAYSLMSEIMAMPYEDPDTAVPINYGPETDEPASPTNRSTFDDTDDYDSWSSAPELRDGTAIPGTTGWTRSVLVEKITWDDPTWTLGYGQADRGVRRVSVSVTNPDGVTTTLRSIRSKHGAIEQIPALDTDVVTTVTISLTAGDAASTTNTGSAANHASGS